jgi:hypothetical protein
MLLDIQIALSEDTASNSPVTGQKSFIMEIMVQL